MKKKLLLITLLMSPLAFSNQLLDAENEEEAIGIMYGVMTDIDVMSFMCERKLSNKSETISSAVNSWVRRNQVVITNFKNGLEKTPISEMEKIAHLSKKAVETKIIKFNDLTQVQKEDACMSLVNRLDSDLYRKEYPKTYEFMSK